MCSAIPDIIYSLMLMLLHKVNPDVLTYLLQLQLQQLMDTLNSTEPHYIRCVKPNNELKPAILDSNNVMQQLRSGVSNV